MSSSEDKLLSVGCVGIGAGCLLVFLVGCATIVLVTLILMGWKP